MTWHRVDAAPSSEIVLESTVKYVNAQLPGVLNNADVDFQASEASRFHSPR
jgi:hypothetical protein